MLNKHYVAMTLFMLIKSAIAGYTYGEHPMLLVSDKTIATTPKSHGYYCVSNSICTYVTEAQGWWKDEANIDCADSCSKYSAAAMTAVSGWVRCEGYLQDNCAATQSTPSCTITFPTKSINTAPTATQGSGTVSLDLGDLSTIASSCTLTLSIVDLKLAGTATTDIVTVNTATRVVSYDTTNAGIVTFKLQAAGVMTYGTWSWGSNSQSGTITVDPCKSATFTDTLTPASPSKMATFQVQDPDATFAVTFTSFTSSPSACAPSTYRLSTDSTSGLTLDNAAKTVTVNSNVRSKIADYTFTVEALKSDGTYYNSGTSYIISVACTSSVTISAPSALSTTTQYGKIGVTSANFNWNYDFTTNYASCAILTQELTNAGSGTAALPTNYAYPSTDEAGTSSLTIPFTSFAFNKWSGKTGYCVGIARFGSGNTWRSKATTGSYGCWSMYFYGNQNGAGNNKQCQCKRRYEAKLADVTKPASYNFYLKVSATGGTITYFGPYSYLLQCASLVAGAMTKHASFVISAPASMTTTQTFLIGQSDLYFKFEAFTVSHAGCPIQSYQLTDAKAKIVAASPTGINTASGTTISLDSGYLKVYPTDTTSAQTLTFYVIVGTMGPLGSESNVYPENFGPYKIDIACGRTSAADGVTSEITVSAPSGLQSTQTFAIGDSNIYFETSAFTPSYSNCPITKYDLSDSSGTATITKGLGHTETALTIDGTSSTYKILPSSASTVSSVTFYMLLALTGGKTTNQGPYVLDIKCSYVDTVKGETKTNVVISEPASIKANQTVFIGTADAHFVFEAFSSNHATPCPMVKYELTSTKNGSAEVPKGIKDPAGATAGLLTAEKDGSFKVYVDDDYSPSVRTFYIIATATGNVTTFGPYTLNLTCEYNTTTVTQAVVPGTTTFLQGEQVKNYAEFAEFIFNHSCCPLLNYTIIGESDDEFPSALTTDSPVGPDTNGKYKVYVKDPTSVQKIGFRVRAFYTGNYNYTTSKSKIVVQATEMTMNFPPFIESSSESWTIDLGKADFSKNLRYTFPSITDAEGDTVLITPPKKQKKWTIIEEEGVFTLEVTPDSIKKLGKQNKTFEFDITDNVSTMTSTFELEVSVVGTLPKPVLEVPDIVQQSIEKIEVVEPKAIKLEPPKPLDYKLSIDQQGNFSIKFNQEIQPSEQMQKLFDKRYLAKSDLDQLVQIKYEQDASAEPELNAKQTFSYDFEELNGKELKMKMDFGDPLSVSFFGDNYDSLNVEINQEAIANHFKTQDGQKVVFKDNSKKKSMKKTVPLQKTNDEEVLKLQEQQEEGLQMMEYTALIQFILMQVLSAAMNKVWSAANTLQLVAHLSQIRITKYPACITFFLGKLIKMVNFEVVPEFVFTPVQEFIFPLESDITFSQDFNDMGYETGFALVSMFTYNVILIYGALYYSYYYLIYKHYKKMRIHKDLRKTYKKNLQDRYTFFLRMVIEGTLNLMVCGFLEIVMKQTTSIMERFSYCYAVASILVMLWFLMKSSSMIFKDYEKMGNEVDFPIFNNRWGILWEDLKISSDNLALFQFYFVLRRLLFAAIVVFPRAYTEIQSIYLFQYFGVVYLSLGMGSYLVGHKPFLKPELNKIEIFNEFCYLQITILMMTLAYSNKDASQDPIIKNQVGMIIISCILLLFGINLLFVLRDLYREQVLKFKRKMNIKREDTRLRDLMKLAEKQKNDVLPPLSKDGLEIPKIDIGDVEWQMQQLEEAQNKEDEDEEVDDLYYEAKTDEEFIEKKKQRQQRDEKASQFGKWNKKSLQKFKAASNKKLLMDVIKEETYESLPTVRSKNTEQEEAAQIELMEIQKELKIQEEKEQKAAIVAEKKEELRAQVGKKDHWSKKHRSNPARHVFSNNVKSNGEAPSVSRQISVKEPKIVEDADPDQIKTQQKLDNQINNDMDEIDNML